MKQLFDDRTTHMWSDGNNLLVTDPAGVYLYHLGCGGLKMSHVLTERDYATLKEYQEVMRAVTFPCECAPHATYKPTVQQVLANLRVSLSVYLEQSGVDKKTMEGVREIILRAASRDEMRETDRRVL